jgi:hypothetical protein
MNQWHDLSKKSENKVRKCVPVPLKTLTSAWVISWLTPTNKFLHDILEKFVVAHVVHLSKLKVS